MCTFARGDPAPATVRAFLLEAQATYATGVLAALVEDPQTSQASLLLHCNFHIHVVHIVQASSASRRICWCHDRDRTMPYIEQLAHDVQVFVRSDVPAGLMRFLRRCASKAGGPAAIHASSAGASASADVDRSAAALPAAAERLRALRRGNAVVALTFLGDYLECLSPLLHVSAVAFAPSSRIILA